MRIFRAILFAGLTAMIPMADGADAWPSRSIRFIVPYPPGGPTDLMARSMSGRLTEALGQTVIVDNR
ncbi:MAG TPA: tripartite tricarboxylate transporter substrate binding protein, partial [Burkholderiales bacterium]|nr:tripartite tricarboxylate transporter substrate binding protein [Burkholderiales bacterium]